MIGKFDYHNGCPTLHHVPQGRSVDGKPLIVFPEQEASKLEIGSDSELHRKVTIQSWKTPQAYQTEKALRNECFSVVLKYTF
jgi:hypothetical protein